MIEAGGREGVGRHGTIEPVAPGAKLGPLRRHQCLTSDEEGGGIDIQRQAEAAGIAQRLRHIGGFEKSVMHSDGVEAFAQFFDVQPPLRRHQRRVVDCHIHDHDPFVKDLVVLEVVQQRTGNDIGAR